MVAKHLFRAFHMVNFYKNWQISRIFLVCDRKKKTAILVHTQTNKCEKQK